MKTRTMVVCCMLMAIYLLLPQPCRASFFEMTLKQDSIYAPGKMNLTMKLTSKAKIEGNYRFKISIYVADTLVRKQTLPVTKKKSALFELTFPDVHSKTDVRCQTELFIDSQFIEAKAKPLTLWPPIAAYPKQSISSKVIWAFDTSGKLQKFFKDLEVAATDATFQAARDFETPDIVFIGQYVDPKNMQVITHYLMSVETKPVIIFLRQKQLLKNAKIEIPEENNRSKSVVCDPNSPLLQGLTRRDIMNMVNNAIYIKIKRKKDKNRSVDSCVTEAMKDKKNIYSYLCTIKEKGQVTIHCQLPVTDRDDPRFRILFRNILKFADKISDSQKN